ncbi:MAG: hypothetical protein R3A47_04500 [Polyangiales bacterium]
MHAVDCGYIESLELCRDEFVGEKHHVFDKLISTPHARIYLCFFDRDGFDFVLIEYNLRLRKIKVQRTSLLAQGSDFVGCAEQSLQ